MTTLKLPSISTTLFAIIVVALVFIPVVEVADYAAQGHFATGSGWTAGGAPLYEKGHFNEGIPRFTHSEGHNDAFDYAALLCLTTALVAGFLLAVWAMLAEGVNNASREAGQANGGKR